MEGYTALKGLVKERVENKRSAISDWRMKQLSWMCNKRIIMLI